jgi:hypothetical protein
MRPSDFALGVADFFSVLLPGAIATWAISNYLPRPLAEKLDILSSGSDAARWAAFLVCSYTVGHFVFMLSSKLDPAYDRWRARTKPPDEDRTFTAANELRRELTKKLPEAGFTTLKWAKSYITIHCPEARAEIDRLEADQKFFRSLVLIAVGLALHFLFGQQQGVLGLASFGMAVLAFHRYCDQRWKMTELAYATAVILHATKPPAKSESPKAHAGDD